MMIFGKSLEYITYIQLYSLLLLVLQPLRMDGQVTHCVHNGLRRASFRRLEQEIKAQRRSVRLL